MRDSPDIVGHLWDHCVDLRFISPDDDCKARQRPTIEARSESRAGQVVPSSERSLRLQAARTEMAKRHRKKIPSKYLTLGGVPGGMSACMLQDRIRAIRGDWSKDALCQHLTCRGQPDVTKQRHTDLLEALTGISKDFELKGEHRYEDALDELLLQNYLARGKRFDGEQLPIDLDDAHCLWDVTVSEEGVASVRYKWAPGLHATIPAHALPEDSLSWPQRHKLYVVHGHSETDAVIKCGWNPTWRGFLIAILFPHAQDDIRRLVATRQASELKQQPPKITNQPPETPQTSGSCFAATAHAGQGQTDAKRGCAEESSFCTPEKRPRQTQPAHGNGAGRIEGLDLADGSVPASPSASLGAAAAEFAPGGRGKAKTPDGSDSTAGVGAGNEVARKPKVVERDDKDDAVSSASEDESQQLAA